MSKPPVIKTRDAVSILSIIVQHGVSNPGDGASAAVIHKRLNEINEKALPGCYQLLKTNLYTKRLKPLTDAQLIRKMDPDRRGSGYAVDWDGVLKYCLELLPRRALHGTSNVFPKRNRSASLKKYLRYQIALKLYFHIEETPTRLKQHTYPWYKNLDDLMDSVVSEIVFSGVIHISDWFEDNPENYLRNLPFYGSGKKTWLERIDSLP